MKNLSILNILLLISAIAVLFYVEPVVDWVFRNHFEKNILPNSPEANFNYYFSQSRIDFDKHLMYGIWGFIVVITVWLIYLDFKLASLKEKGAPDKTDLLKIFMSRCLAYIFILTALPLNSVILDKNISSELLSFGDKITLISFGFIMVNSLALVPYLAQRNISEFFSFKSILIFNVGMIVCLSILMWIGVSQYAAASIAGLLSGLPFAKKIMEGWKKIESFFNIKGKRLDEMF